MQQMQIFRISSETAVFHNSNNNIIFCGFFCGTADKQDTSKEEESNQGCYSDAS